MKKRITCLIIICILIFSVTGCGNKKMKKEEKEYNIYDSINSKYSNYKKSIVCSELDDAVDISDDFRYFITKDHKIYELSYDKLFSNNENCKQLDTEYQLLRFFDYRAIGTDGTSLYEIGYTSLKFNTSYREAKNIILGGKEKETYYDLKDNKNKSKDKYIYLLIKDGNIVADGEDIVFQPKENETIDYIVDRTIKTNKNIYVFDKKNTNQEECDKYADVDCIERHSFYPNDSFIYGKNDNLIKNNVNDIAFYKYNGTNTFVMMKDGSVYTDASVY